MDVRLFWAINSLSRRTDSLNRLMILVSNRIRYVYLFVLLILLLKNKSISLNAVLSIAASMVIGSIIRLFSFRARPFVNNRAGILIPSKRNSSFPSKHTLLTFAVSTTLCLYNRTLGGIFTCLSALTGLSRVWVGHHYPSDILGSALIGSFVSVLTRLITFNRQPSN
ncbi:phosphatase PAP2 family protein [Bacillus sp. SG-1]|uniref:phosphatase PAP2 family protein n=1 Tax=Bacillus sp. SG-1 TaxID=161544 RepID=UPI00015452DB|nr:phosphatase PAP2 family protein [Bacillus sp. SG-1]EDL63509.1 probable phosphatase, PAP2 superfamily; possible bacitracin transport permease [Bacillus sp. SG-1]